MFNVGIDLERLRSVNSGLGQFCLHLSEHLLREKGPGLALHLYYPKHYDKRLNAPAYQVSLKDKLFGVGNRSLQLFHCTHQDSHLFPRNIATLLTIHDLNFLEKYTDPAKRDKKLRLLQHKVNRSKGISFISRYTEQLVKQHIRMPDIPTRVIYNGNCLDTSLAPVKPADMPFDTFLFGIGIINPKKNFHTLLPLVKQTGLPLVIAGNHSHSYAGSILHQAAQMGIADKVVLTGPVSEQEKLWLYTHCKAFVFPSLSEGFGLPVAEAMSLGKPVFLSDKTSLPEVGGPHAFYWTSFEPGHMIDVLIKGLADAAQRQEASMAWAAQFSWQHTARQYLDFYSDIYGSLI